MSESPERLARADSSPRPQAEPAPAGDPRAVCPEHGRFKFHARSNTYFCEPGCWRADAFEQRLAKERALREHEPTCPARVMDGSICRCPIIRGEVLTYEQRQALDEATDGS